jgi:class 3 adenylate cyclase
VSCWSPKRAPALSLKGWRVVVGWGWSGVRVLGALGLAGLVVVAAFGGDALGPVLGAGASALTGECEIRGDDIGGIGVHIGARVSALAGPNDVLVSSTLRDLVIGSGLGFEERGAHELKGVPGEWRLFAVASK